MERPESYGGTKRANACTRESYLIPRVLYEYFQYQEQGSLNRQRWNGYWIPLRG